MFQLSGFYYRVGDTAIQPAVQLRWGSKTPRHLPGEVKRAQRLQSQPVWGLLSLLMSKSSLETAVKGLGFRVWCWPDRMFITWRECFNEWKQHVPLRSQKVSARDSDIGSVNLSIAEAAV